MTCLFDQSPAKLAQLAQEYTFVGGQLVTPLTRYSLAPAVAFAVDNGAYSGRCGLAEFGDMLARLQVARARCLFAALPDVVGSARRTLEIFEIAHAQFYRWPLALVCQDGQESLPIPWAQIAAVFIGGSTGWKMSVHAAQIIRAAQVLGRHVHVGRVNTVARWRYFEQLGVDTCDGSGLCRFTWMRDAIQAAQGSDHGI